MGVQVHAADMADRNNAFVTISVAPDTCNLASSDHALEGRCSVLTARPRLAIRRTGLAALRRIYPVQADALAGYRYRVTIDDAGFAGYLGSSRWQRYLGKEKN